MYVCEFQASLIYIAEFQVSQSNGESLSEEEEKQEEEKEEKENIYICIHIYVSQMEDTQTQYVVLKFLIKKN